MCDFGAWWFSGRKGGRLFDFEGGRKHPSWNERRWRCLTAGLVKFRRDACSILLLWTAEPFQEKAKADPPDHPLYISFRKGGYIIKPSTIFTS